MLSECSKEVPGISIYTLHKTEFFPNWAHLSNWLGRIALGENKNSKNNFILILNFPKVYIDYFKGLHEWLHQYEFL